MRVTTVLRVLRFVRFILVLRRIDAMYKQSMNVAKGIGLGLITGAAVAAIGAKAMNGGSTRKAAHMKKSASRAIHTVGNVLGDMEKMLR